ncbi:hypothetical protein ACQHIV_04825 [Kribbella sp. GL6]|uniref:hypothetical protein n=1 Tax=Kribbella sp. GL6 TaxID=3419765 RepID=UPI003D003C8D
MQYDDRPLRGRITSGQVSAFRRAVRRGDYGPPVGRAAAPYALNVVWRISVVLCAGAAIATPIALFAHAQSPATILGTVFVITLAAIFAFSYAAGWTHWRRWARLDAFARANGWRMQPSTIGPRYPGAIFRKGTKPPEVRDRLICESGRYFDIGNYFTSTGSRADTEYNELELSQYVAVRLRSPVPDITLVAPGYQLDHTPDDWRPLVRAAFPPEALALLTAFRIEISGEWLLLTRQGHFDPAKPSTWQHLLSIVDLAFHAADTLTPSTGVRTT